MSQQVTEPIVIEKGIPIPRDRRCENYTATMKTMNVGDSFFTTAPRLSVAHMMGYVHKKHGLKFTMRTIKDGPTPGVRVWRTR